MITGDSELRACALIVLDSPRRLVGRTPHLRTAPRTDLVTAVAIARNIGLLAVGAHADYEAMDCERLRPGGEYFSPAEVDGLVADCLVAGARVRTQIRS